MKKLRKLFAMLLALCMMMSLLSVNAFADEVNDGGEAPAEVEPVAGPVYRCQKDEHPHTDACYTTLTCQKVVHSEACYTEGELTCVDHAVTRDLICELHAHDADCYHTHSDVSGNCYQLDCKDPGDPDCGKTEETVECTLTEEHTEHTGNCSRHQHDASCNHHQHDASCYAFVCQLPTETPNCGIESEHAHDTVECYEDHAHIRACYDDVPDCGKNEHVHDASCIPPSGGYYTNPINENIDVTLYNYGSYINVGPEKSLQFGWHNVEADSRGGNYVGRPYEGIDGPAMRTDGTVFTSWHKTDANDIGVYYSNKIYNFPTVDRVLNTAGYPQIAATQMSDSNKNSGEIVDVSLEYLFPKTGAALKTGAAPNPLTNYDTLRTGGATFIPGNGYNSNYESMRFDMVGDGGLFAKDADGYYTYNSSELSAYYDQDAKRFLMSDTLIGPSHYGAEEFKRTPAFAKNFLPFNKIDFSNTDQFYKFNDNQWVYMTKFAKDGSVVDDLADLWFGFDMEFDFFVPKGGQVNGEDMKFYFKGDDDIWVYIDDVLILDIAGCHGAVDSWINFADGQVYNYNVGYSTGSKRQQYTTIKAQFEGALGADYVAEHMAGEFTEDGAFVDYSKHTLKFFYTERGGNISYCQLKFNMPALPSGSLSVGKQVEDMKGNTPAFITDALSYEFRVLEADANGAVTNNLFIPAGSSYDIVDANNYENVLGSGKVGAEGYFTLKDGQVALFKDVFTKYGNKNYVVEERIPTQFSGVYGEVEYVADNESVSNRVTTGDAEAKEYLTYVTPALASDETQKVTFTNKVKVDLTKPEEPGEEGEEVIDPMIATLSITKQETGDLAPQRQETYQIRVLAGYSEDTMQPLSEGAKYTVGETEKTVKDGGIIELKAGETAELVFLEGTSYKVEEIVDSQYTYIPSYQNAEGMIDVEETKDVEAVVINTYYVPGNGDSGDNDGNEGGGTDEPSNPGPSGGSTDDSDTTIEDEDVPMTELPTEGAENDGEDAPLVSLPEGDVPLTAMPDEEVPLAVLPATGDATLIWTALSALSGAGVFLTRKKRDEE